MIAASVPAAEAMVWTILFSRIEALRNQRSTAIEITAAGIEVAKVSADLEPEIDVGGGEEEGDRAAEEDAAQRQLTRRSFPGSRVSFGARHALSAPAPVLRAAAPGPRPPGSGPRRHR